MQTIVGMSINNRSAMATPSSSSTVLLRRLLVVLFTLLIGFFILAMQANIFPINQIYIEGDLKRLNQNRLKILVAHKVQNGFFRANPRKVRDLLLTLPWVKEVAVYKIWPDSMKIIVHEQIAFARWGNNGFLNAQGDYFEADEFAAELQYLPLLQSTQEQQKILFGYLNKLIQTYHFNVVRLCMGMQCPLEFELDSGLIVRLGRKDFDNHIERFNSIFMGMQKELLQAKKIDMRYPNGFAVEWKVKKSGT